MAFIQLAKNALETAGHGIATGATALADEVTAGRVPELRRARTDQEQRMHAAARGVETNARTVGNDLGRILGTTGVSLGVLAKIVTSPDQLRRLIELIETHDFPGLLRALQRGAEFPNDFFPNWIRRAGGYFPKFAQVLSVRADLIHNREVLEQLGRCLEDMPARSKETVREHLLSQGWQDSVCRGVRETLNSGSVAQVNSLTMPDGSLAVVKVAWTDTRRQMQTDFRLFSHAREILAALRLEDDQSRAVGALFSAVGKSEPAVIREFDMQKEAEAMCIARSLCGNEWTFAYNAWLDAAGETVPGLPPDMTQMATLGLGHLRIAGCSIQVPEPLSGLCSDMAFAMTKAGGESLHNLLSGAAGAVSQQEAASALIGYAVPFIGWLLLCKSTSHLAHIDPHPGNFRWDAGTRQLWVLDWGSHMTMVAERRRALCLVVLLVATDGEDSAVAETARSFGIRGTDDRQIAFLIRGMMNATSRRAAQDAINSAAVDHILDDVSEDVVPVVRCLAILGGMLKEVQRKVRNDHNQNIPLSLAALWATFASMGLEGD